MRFPASFLDDLKARLPVSEVVRRRVKLTKAGREWRGLSPFNAERTPSFYVNDQKMAWFDHSANKNGNIFDFLMETEGLSFPEAVERLAQDAGLPLPRATPEAEAQEKQRASLHEVLEAAAAFFVATLASGAGVKARDYLAGRSLTPALQSEFRIGYAPPDKFALRDHLASKGIQAEAMIEAGLLVHGDEIAAPYDRFRDRVMFPIADRNGRVIAFGGRALSKDVQAKYLNSPETVLFRKGAVLYNHHRARKAAHDKGSVIAVEGYVDVIAMSAAGFPQAVAACGTALTLDQCDLLWKMAEEPILCFDGDRAGRKAAFRAIDLALPLIGVGRSLRFALLPEGQDPDDLARSGGSAAIGAVIEAALPLVDLIWQRETEADVLATPERRAALEHRLLALCGEIRDETLRRHYQAEFRERLGGLFQRRRPDNAAGFSARNRQPQTERREFRRGRFAPAEPQAYASLPLSVGADLARSPFLRSRVADLSARESLIFLILLNHPGLLDPYGDAFAELDLGANEALAVRKRVLDLWAHGPLPADELRAGLATAGFDAFLRRLDASAHAILWIVSPEAADSDAEEALKQALALHHKMRALNSELHSAQDALAQDASEVNLARLLDIREQLSALTGTEAMIEGFGMASGRQSGMA
ncbi:MAG: DNA primase [Methylovirgula sp.]